MTDKISHEGIVDSVTADEVLVRIVQTSACAQCKASSYCNASESKVKTVSVARNAVGEQPFRVGEKVVVYASKDIAGKALLFCFGIPFLLIVLTLVVMLWLTDREILSALASLAVLAPYYITLYFMRNQIGRRVAFSIEKIN